MNTLSEYIAGEYYDIVNTQTPNGNTKHHITLSNDYQKIGTVTVSIIKGETWITDVHVDPEFRKEGYGRKLVTYVTDKYPHPINIRVYSYDTHVTDDDLVEFYEHLGFKQKEGSNQYYMVYQ